MPAGSSYFQLVIDGELFGDREPSIIDSTMQELRSVPTLDVDPAVVSRLSAAEILAELRADDTWNEATLQPSAESLDGAQVRSFICGTDVSYLAGGGVEGSVPMRIAKVSLDDYAQIVEAAVNYWTAAEALD
jgi:hypothetical protein